MTKITKVATTHIELDDTSLAGAADLMQREIAKFIVDEGPFASIQVLPCRATYSVPIEGSHRDSHYAENGFIVVGFR